MNITEELVSRAVKTAKEYNGKPPTERVELGVKLNEVTYGLSDAQCVQLARIVQRKI